MPLPNDVYELTKSKAEEDRRAAIPFLEKFIESHNAQADATSDLVEAWFRLACCNDFLGQEKEAQPAYEKVHSLGVQYLRLEDQPSFYVGYGSTLRNNGSLYYSQKILEEGLQKFPDYPALKVFLAFTLYSQGRTQLSSQYLFQTLSQMPKGSLDGYESAIQHYTEILDNN
jgi:tetratricopeptide (TPR) repeat protein